MAAKRKRQPGLPSNDGVVRGYRWLATLDRSTCIGCAVRDGLSYDLDLEPVGHALPWGRGPGRRHAKCRCTMTPVLDDEFAKYMRGAWRPAVANGRAEQVPAETTYSQWFQRQSEAFQSEYLGPMRFSLLRKHNLDLIDLVDDAGRPLSYANLLQRFSPQS